MLDESFSVLLEILRMGRPHFLGGGILLFLFGAGIAISGGGIADAQRIAFAYLALFAGQLSVSYSNDYFDAEVDRRAKRTLFSGGSGVLVRRPDLKPVAKKIALLLIAASMAFAIASVAFFGMPAEFLAVAALGNLVGWFYSAPPLKLAYRGLGEISTSFTAGFLMPVTGFLAVAGGINWDFALFSVPLFLCGVSFILSVQAPDAESDRKGGKWTFAARNGGKSALALSAFAAACASLCFFAILFSGAWQGAALPWISAASLLPALFGFAGLFFAKNRERRALAAVIGVSALFAFVFLADVALFLS